MFFINYGLLKRVYTNLSKIVLYITITYKEQADLCVGDITPHAPLNRAGVSI